MTARAVTLVLLIACAMSAAAQAPLRQSFDMRVPVAPTPVPVQGKLRLVYELHLANFSGEGLVPRNVEVLDADSGAVIAAFANDDLQRRLYRPSATSGTALPRTIEAGALGVIYLELTLGTNELPQALDHRVTFIVSGQKRSAVVQGAQVPVNAEPPVVLAPPLRGGPWAAVHDPFWTRGHRRFIYAVSGEATIPGRYAIDWIKLDDKGHLARGDRDEVRNWYGYNAAVLAVADGVVAAARDNVAESPTLTAHPDHPLADATGNYIALDIGDGRFVFYEHLKPGSIRVKVGDSVTRGQVIAGLGFTGDSTGPHLHFHVADANSPLGAEGIPFVLDDFRLLGTYDDFDQFGAASWTPLGGALDAHRSDERPAPNTVVEFSKFPAHFP